MSRLPIELHNRIQNFISEISRKPNVEYNFLNNVSALMLIECILANANNLKPVENLTAGQELRLFKAYLFCSQVWIDKQEKGFLNERISDDLGVAKLIIPTQLPFIELLEFKDFRIQFIKAIHFFKFCETNPEFKVYLEIFLKEYKLDSWKFYLKNIISVYVRKFEKLKIPSRLTVSDEFPDIINFLNYLSVDLNNFKSSNDFLYLRQHPVFKISENIFLFLNLNFLVDKLYQGIQFDFANILVKNSATYRGKVIKSVPDFIAIFSNEFSENGLFYKVMDYVFEKSGYIKLTGESLKAYLRDGEPDYYIREKAKVYLFEFKNVFIGAEVKHSYDFDRIKSEIDKKLVSNQNNSPKGVTQLVNVIEKVKAGEFSSFDKFDFENVIIYPVIVFVDFSFNIPGMNYLLRTEFRKLLTERKVKNTQNVKDLVMIDLDTFIKFQDLFRDKRIKINNCLNEYIGYSRSPFNKIKHVTGFSTFIHNKVGKMEYGSPKMLMEEVLKLIPEWNE